MILGAFRSETGFFNSPQWHKRGRELAKLLAGLLLAIRKGAGNDDTQLDK